MNKEQARQILAELNRRKELKQNKPQFYDPKFKEQAAFILDDSNLLSALCTRRAGKSYGAGLKVHDVLFNKHPGSTALYIGLTKDSARRILWEHVVKDINKKWNLNGKPNESTLTMRFPNGSIFQLVGADAKPDEMEKFLGGKYSIVVIDESGSFKQDVRRLVYDNLEPATADYDGQICMVGTPSPLIKCFFAEVTQGKENGWSKHRWTTFENPYMADKWRKQEERVVERNPAIVETPGYKRNRLGEWVIDQDEYVYKFSKDRNYLPAIPDSASSPYSYVIGIDLGYNDATAFHVWGFREYDTTLYGVRSFKRSKMIVSEVARVLNDLRKEYRPIQIVVDNASKQVVEELKRRHQIPMEAAVKTDKEHYIEIMNSDYICGNIKLTPACSALIDEYENLVWEDVEAIKKVEHPGCENHLCDAALYGWRWAYNYLALDKPDENKTEEQKIDEWFEEQAEIMAEKENLEYWEQ